MTGTAFKKGVFASLGRCGFVPYASLMRASGDGVTVLIGVEHGFGAQWFINVGFCFDRLGANHHRRVEQADMYFRLERLFPQFRDRILAGGQLDAPDLDSAYQSLLDLLSGEIGAEVMALASEPAARRAYASGRFRDGLVTAEARFLLTGSP